MLPIMFKRIVLQASAAALLMFTSLLGSTTARAADDDLCVPQARGVPGPQNKFPEWWVAAAPGKAQRWTGASLRTGKPAGSATPEMATLRTVWDAPSRRLFLHWSIKGDPQINPQQDMVALALTDTSGNPLLYIDARPLLGCATTDTTDLADVSGGCQGGELVSGGTPTSPAVRYANGTAGAWGSVTPVNGSAAEGFAVVDENHWVQVSQSGALFDWDFKVSLQLPVGSSNQVDPNVRIYGTSFVAFKSGPGIADPVVTFEYPLLCNPDGLASTCEMDHGAAGPTLPDAVPSATTQWPAIQTGGIGDCKGIELDRDLVGSDESPIPGVVPGTSSPYSLPGRTIRASSGSRLRAGFHNDTTEALTTGSLQAEFRIANWGLTYADWDEATWDLVATAPLAGAVAAGAYGGGPSQGAIQSDPYIAGSVPTNDHQCMHVKLSGTPGSGDSLKFKVDSVYRNMDFVNASVVRRPADVNLIGRPLAPRQTAHPVYLVVRTHNMPSPARCSQYQGDLEGCFAVDWTKDPASGLPRLPYYTVHGFVDSGRRVNLPEAPQTPILTPFSSYGYYVQHRGKVEGWEHRLDGAPQLEPYSSVYRLDVAPGHVASVVDTIRVVDDQTSSCLEVAPPVVDPGSSGVVAGGVPGSVPTPASSSSSSKLGCEPAKVRPQCKPDECDAHDPCSYVEGSEYTHAQSGEPPAEEPPASSPGPGTCCFNTAQTPAQKVGGAGGASCMFVMLWGLRRRRCQTTDMKRPSRTS